MASIICSVCLDATVPGGSVISVCMLESFMNPQPWQFPTGLCVQVVAKSMQWLDTQGCQAPTGPMELGLSKLHKNNLYGGNRRTLDSMSDQSWFLTLLVISWMSFNCHVTLSFPPSAGRSLVLLLILWIYFLMPARGQIFRKCPRGLLDIVWGPFGAV